MSNLVTNLGKNQIASLDSLLISCSSEYFCWGITTWSIDDKLESKPKYPVTGRLMKLMLIFDIRIITRSVCDECEPIRNVIQIVFWTIATVMGVWLFKSF